jgi:hypothetical protein
MAIDHTQLTDVPHRPGTGPFTAVRAEAVVIDDRLKALAARAAICPPSRAAPMRRDSIHRRGWR